MDDLVRQRLPADLRQGARIMAETKTFGTGRALMDDAADEIERIGNVAAGRLRWLSMMSAGGEHSDLVAFQAREWADEMDPNIDHG